MSWKPKNHIQPYFVSLVLVWIGLIVLLVSFLSAFSNHDVHDSAAHLATIHAHIFVMVTIGMLVLFGLFWGYHLMMIKTREREELENELLRNHKIESLKLLAGGIAHNFNNILLMIKLGTDLINESLPKNPENLHLNKSVNSAISRASLLANKLKIFCQDGLSNKSLVKLNNIIEELASLIVTGSEIDIKLSLDPGLSEVFGDPNLLSQLIIDLIVNSKEAMPDGGELNIITVNCLDIRPSAKMSRGNYVKLIIRDSGCGISDFHLWSIRDPFFSTKDFGGGLGLTCANSIVKNHDGELNVISRLGVGTYFTIYLPSVISN